MNEKQQEAVVAFNADEKFSDYDEPAKVAYIVPTKTDVESAEEIRGEVRQHLDDICAVLNRAKDRGFVVSFQLQSDAMGRQFISNLIVAKHF